VRRVRCACGGMRVFRELPTSSHLTTGPQTVTRWVAALILIVSVCPRACLSKLGCKSVVDRDPTAIPRTRTVQAAPVRARKTVRAQCSRIRSVQASTTAEAGMADVVYPFDSLCRQHTCMYLSLLAHSLQHGHCQQRLLGPRVVSADP
jgi:hypothetical protein